MKQSEVVIALAELASKGTYNVDPNGARHMTIVYEAVARLINELEAAEAVVEVSTDE